MHPKVKEVLDTLNDLADPKIVAHKKRQYGIIASNSKGIYHKDLRVVAKEIGKDSELAIQLFETNVYEARILCSKIFPVKDLEWGLMKHWVKSFENWEICDSFSMGLFSKSKWANKWINKYHNKKQEFEKRSAFATLASYCMADKKASNEVYEAFIPFLLEAATDERIYVKKAVNWALRSIGKRNQDLHEKAIETAEYILSDQFEGNKGSDWIAKDAIRQLQKETVNILDYPRQDRKSVV